jgi:hypothetical protein
MLNKVFLFLKDHSGYCIKTDYRKQEWKLRGGYCNLKTMVFELEWKKSEVVGIGVHLGYRIQILNYTWVRILLRLFII